jgi:hypothetical protein
MYLDDSFGKGEKEVHFQDYLLNSFYDETKQSPILVITFFKKKL